ncbi:MAG: hypothetical protein IJR14_03270 [Synergistaceae bacterium]|nr:hypothetical protein [Synergistaceae bacterium]
MEWIKAPADAPVCAEKGVTLKDVVQLLLDGLGTREAIMEELGLTEADEGTGQIDDILEAFSPVVDMWRAGACGGCAGCGGGCCGCGD